MMEGLREFIEPGRQSLERREAFLLWPPRTIEIKLELRLSIHLVFPRQKGGFGRRKRRRRLPKRRGAGRAAERALERASRFAGLFEIEVAAGQAPWFHLAKFPPRG